LDAAVLFHPPEAEEEATTPVRQGVGVQSRTKAAVPINGGDDGSFAASADDAQPRLPPGTVDCRSMAIQSPVQINGFAQNVHKQYCNYQLIGLGTYR
jgi:hypothetical protein